IPGITITAGETTTVNVALKLPGDATGDGKVDASDLALVAGAFNTQDAASDLNADGVVNIFDLVKVGINFGRTESPWE
ncbi:dockerin type I domain-containing protein, partial [Dehalococcoidia bacterium]|nr:dockerin type I domain-containing protein [Dehalococcoidia bacterium]